MPPRRRQGRLGVALAVATAVAGLAWLAFGALLTVADLIHPGSRVVIAELVTEPPPPELPEPPLTSVPEPPKPETPRPRKPKRPAVTLEAPEPTTAEPSVTAVSEAEVPPVAAAVSDTPALPAVAAPAPAPSPAPETSVARRAEAPLSAIAERLERTKRYPPLAVRRGIEGIVEIRFRLWDDGGVQSLDVARSSGSTLLDAAAADTVRRGAPYPWRSGWIVVPIVFALD